MDLAEWAKRQARPEPYHTRYGTRSSRSRSVDRPPELGSLHEFDKRTGIDLLRHPIICSLANCESADSIIDVLQERAQAFRGFRGDDGAVIKWLKPTVYVPHALPSNGILAGGPFPPANAIFAAVGIHGVPDPTTVECSASASRSGSIPLALAPAAAELGGGGGGGAARAETRWVGGGGGQRWMIFLCNVACEIREFSGDQVRSGERQSAFPYRSAVSRAVTGDPMYVPNDPIFAHTIRSSHWKLDILQP
ncbi:hypothetical protein BC826DRAFT_1179602 [Russula brevipes]|nr:hypothetical protein BC826DRAFT_1179602 [Russula brevipes]